MSKAQISISIASLIILVYVAIILSADSDVTSQDTITDLKAKNNELVSIIRGIGSYEAPVKVWEKELLAPGVSSSAIMPQIPIERMDGTLEDNKAIMIERGDWVFSDNDSKFIQSSNGEWFKINLIVDDKLKGSSTGLLLTQGYGTAIWCRDALPDPSASSNKFNCYFKVTLQNNGGVGVLWTMFHPTEMEILK